MKMNWRKWKLGFVVATLCALFVAGAGLTADMNWRGFLAVLCTALLTHWGTFLSEHPIEDLPDDSSGQKPG